MNGTPALQLSDIVGAWILESAVSQSENEDTYPFGTEPEGVLMYTPDAWVSATIVTVGDGPTPGQTFYAGPVTIEGDTIVHDIHVGVAPFEPGNTQSRQARIGDDGKLILTTPEGQVVSGRITLTWRRPTEGER